MVLRADREASALLRSMGAGRIKEFLFDSDLLTDNNGKPLDKQPAWAEFFTNEYLQD